MNDPTIDAGIQLAETIQTTHIRHHPDPRLDNAPETSIDTKQVVDLNSDDIDSGAEEDEIPVSMLRPTPRRAQMPPLPDMRFEQSYLASIKDCAGWQGVAYITLRDQVMMPFLQGTVWALAVAGWRHWNKEASFKGQTVGSRVRRWWWGVNNWTIPDAKEKVSQVKEEIKDAASIAEFYHTKPAVGGD